MIYEHRKKIILITIALFTVLSLVWLVPVIWSYVNSYAQQEKISTQATPTNLVLDLSSVKSMITSKQSQSVLEKIPSTTSTETKKDTTYKAIIREDSVRKTKNQFSTNSRFIIDSSDYKASFLVERSIGDGFDILNIQCVDEKDRIYKNDTCIQQ